MIRYARVHSDLHLEQYSGAAAGKCLEQMIEPHELDGESALILAGDISSRIPQLIDFLEACESRFERVLYVPGNHEFYRHDMAQWDEEFRDAAGRLGRTDYATLGVEELRLGPARVIAGTLWADGGGDQAERDRVQKALADFYLMRAGGELFTVDKMREIHREHVAEISRLLNAPRAPDETTVVVTHHMPSLRLVSERFWHPASDTINGGFASDLDSILSHDQCSPDVWVFGHTHDRIDTRLWGTRCVCNPTGYYREYGNGFSGGGPVFIDLENPRAEAAA